MILVDTNVLSEMRSIDGSPIVRRRVEAYGNDVFVSAIVMGEIIYGVGALPEGRKQKELRHFYDLFCEVYADRILPITHDIAEVWGRLRAARRAAGRPLALADGLIAATALHHNLTLMTRNTRDFDLTGVKLLNPWEG